MADPRFYDNHGPFTLAQICAASRVTLPAASDGTVRVLDLASLTGAGPDHLTFYSGSGSALAAELAQSGAPLRTREQGVGSGEQQQDDCRVPRECQAKPFSEAVRDKIEIARPGTRALRLRPFDVVLERAPGAPGSAEPQTDEELRRLDENRHLVAVVVAPVVETVQR